MTGQSIPTRKSTAMIKPAPPSIEVLCPSCEYWDVEDTLQDKKEIYPNSGVHWCLHPLNTHHQSKVGPRTNCTHWALTKLQTLDKCFTCAHCRVDAEVVILRAHCTRKREGVLGMLTPECLNHAHWVERSQARNAFITVWGAVYAQKIVTLNTTPEQAEECADKAVSILSLNLKGEL